MKPDPANNQQVYDYVATKLAVQGTPSVANGKCLYRAPNGCKCAVGWIIEDEDYDPEWEDRPLMDPCGPGPLLRGDGYDMDLLEGLQEAHDAADDVVLTKSTWRRELLLVAHRFHLDPTKVENMFGDEDS